MKRIPFVAKSTKYGEQSILAYSLGKGLFLHRSLDSTILIDGKVDNSKDWTLSAKNGWAIIHICGDLWDVKFRKILKAAGVLKELDWSNLPTLPLKQWKQSDKKLYLDSVAQFKEALLKP